MQGGAIEVAMELVVEFEIVEKYLEFGGPNGAIVVVEIAVGTPLG